MSLLKRIWAEEACERIADKVLAALDRQELEQAARQVDVLADAPRTRQLTQFIATAAVLRHEAEGVKRP